MKSKPAPSGAVVADEVRNLAIRAADAAKNTAGLIEGTVKRISEGSGFVSSTSEAFSDAAKSSAKVGELVSEITAASDGQSRGIEQVNVAVTEMDNVTQRNAASAEESASSAENMSAKTEEMKDMVDDLVVLVEGKNGKKKVSAAMDPIRKPEQIKPIQPAPNQNTISHHEIDPEQDIPLEDEDFKDF